jgi:hypothetical protein
VGKFNYLSRATVYRYKERFRKIGITENNLIPLTEDGIPRADINLRDYHKYLSLRNCYAGLLVAIITTAFIIHLRILILPALTSTMNAY